MTKSRKLMPLGTLGSLLLSHSPMAYRCTRAHCWKDLEALLAGTALRYAKYMQSG